MAVHTKPPSVLQLGRSLFDSTVPGTPGCCPGVQQPAAAQHAVSVSQVKALLKRAVRPPRLVTGRYSTRNVVAWSTHKRCMPKIRLLL